MSKDYSEWELRPSDDPQDQPELFAPQVEEKRSQGRGVLWALIVLLLVVIVAVATVLYLAVSGRGGQWFGAGAKDEAAPKRTVTATATETVKVKSAEKTKKEHCAASALANDPSRLVIYFCDGQWAVTGVEGTGGFGAWRWDGSGWAEYERHGTQSPSDYACFDIDRLKREGAPVGFQNVVTACEGSETTTSTKKEATKTRKTTSTATSEHPISGDCEASAFPDPRGDLSITACDGLWAVGGPANTGAVFAYQWKDGSWQQVEADSNYTTGSGGPCFSDEFIEERGMTSTAFGRLACNPDKRTD
ncbi:hypothetical protein [uncultured Corynebacterium sp.]|uniref:hypothetical protein n=1 Tax=uncultured Corynebacterium sp. TaxID=159447 RepID=UPI002609B45C|nr:hypothetical protein [uncultured Corynebacterium sp.]